MPLPPSIRIAHIVSTFDIGGLENGIINLINTMDHSEFDHSLYVLSGDAQAKDRFNRAIPVHTLHKRDGNDPKTIFRLLKHYREYKPDIVRTYGWGSWLEGLISSKLYGNNSIIHSEHGYIAEQLGGIPSRRRIAQKLAARFTDHIISVSEAISQTLINEVGIPSNKINTIINGVDTNRFTPGINHDLRQSLSIDENSIILGTVARLDPIKDIASVIQALPELSNIEYIIAGDGPEQSRLEQLAQELKVAKRVHFLGKRSDIPDLMKIFDIFIIPSIKEGTSNTLLEAMATACPVIATHTGGTPDIIAHNETGILIPPQSPESTISAVTEMSSNPNRRLALGKQARKHIVDKWSLDLMVEKYESLYHHAIKQ